jgi:hypothetical protein
MEIKGTFKNVNDETIQVRIWSLEGTFTYDIDTAKDKAIYFDIDPVEIETNCDDAFTEIIIKDCKINLMTKMYLGDYLFSTGLTDIKVEVKNLTRGNYIFCGFVEPEIYSQGYAYHYETLSIHCLDSLGILQYIPYTHTPTSTDYDLYKSNLGIIPFRDVLEHIFEDANVLIEDGVAKPLQWLYVGSNNSNTMNISNDLVQTSINEQLFLGDEESDCMTKEEALSEILKYFNLHAVQEGEYIYLFNRDILKYDGTVKTYSYSDLGGSGNASGLVRHITLTTNDYASDDTTISTDDVYNQIQVKCEREVMDDFIVSPLESDYMTSPFYNKQYYCRIYHSTDSETYTYEHWFLRYKESLNWHFKNNFTYNEQNPINQWSILSSLKTYDYSAALISFGNVSADTRSGYTPMFFTEIKQIPSMSDYLVISVNGNDDVDSLKALVNGEDTDSMVASDGIMKYELNTNGVYSPTSSRVTNYIVFSGDVLYQGLVTSEPIIAEYNKKYNWYARGFVHNIHDTDINHPDLMNPDITSCIMPPTDSAVEFSKFTKMNFDDGNGNTVTVDKIPVLQCVLKIGDKYLSENFVPKYDIVYDEQNQWYGLKKITHEWTTTPSTFALYVQPEIDSAIIGKKHSMINEVSANMQIDVQGQAIPIRYEDNLSGKIEFKILGPYNIDCNYQTEKKNGWWKSLWGDKTDTVTKETSLLGNTEAIFIDKFEVKFVTDNGKINLLKDADLVYYSAENNRYINKKDDIDFKINSGLTFEQSQQMNIMNLPAIGNPTMNNSVVTTFLNGIKPEHAYIDYYYNEYATPKIKLQTTVRNFSNLMDDGDLSTLAALTPHLKTWTVGNYFKDKTFYTLSASYDVKNNTSNLSLKEL